VKVRVETPDGDDGGQPHVYKFEGDADQLPEQIRGMVRDFHVDGANGLRSLAMLGGRGRLGVRIESLNEDLASALGAPGKEGVLVLEVMKDTPAEKAGIKAGDVIIAVKDRGVTDSENLVKTIRELDGKVSITVSRKGSKRTVVAELEPAPRLDRGGDSMGMGRMGDSDRQVIRLRDRAGADNEDLRKQLEELRGQLRDLKHQLEDKPHN
jgi:C-terminal processing protease CtpA/Prc